MTLLIICCLPLLNGEWSKLIWPETNPPLVYFQATYLKLSQPDDCLSQRFSGFPSSQAVFLVPVTTIVWPFGKPFWWTKLAEFLFTFLSLLWFNSMTLSLESMGITVWRESKEWRSKLLLQGKLQWFICNSETAPIVISGSLKSVLVSNNWVGCVDSSTAGRMTIRSLQALLQFSQVSICLSFCLVCFYTSLFLDLENCNKALCF